MIKGIDISEWQKSMNLSILKRSGYDFIILRAGFTGYKTGAYKKDSYFEKFYSQAKSLGIPVGVYYYSCAYTSNLGRDEAKFLYENCLKGKQFEYPIYIDVEDPHTQVGNKKGVTDAIISFCEYLENLGYYVGIYGSDISGFKDKMELARLKAYDKWVASYGSKPRYVLTYGMWQNSSSGRIKGYYGNLDLDNSYKNYPKIIKKAKLNGFSEYQQKPIESKPSSVFYIVKSGDTLSSIAKKYGTTWQKIYNDNKNVIGSNPNLIKPNQKLIIKG